MCGKGGQGGGRPCVITDVHVGVLCVCVCVCVYVCVCVCVCVCIYITKSLLYCQFCKVFVRLQTLNFGNFFLVWRLQYLLIIMYS